MTLNDFLKRVDIEKSKDKMMVFCDGIGWTNVWFKETENTIEIIPDKTLVFSSDK